jgi:DNA polymerase-3 subunit gamma/tau
MVGSKGLTAISNNLKSKKINKSFMITGPVGTGKTTLGRIIAQAVLCAHPGSDGRPCFECDSCRCFSASGVRNHPSYVEENMAVETGVDNMRRHVEVAKTRPLFNKYRVFLFDEAQELTAAAKNAMLKILEEPPANSVFIICSMSPEKFSDKVGKAIMSRCMKVQLQRPTDAEVIGRLRHVCNIKQFKFSDVILKSIAAACDNMMRDCLSTLELAAANGSVVSDDKADAFISKLIGSSPFEIAKQALLGLYTRRIEMVVEAVTASDNVNYLVKAMIEHNTNIIKARVLPTSIANAWALRNAQDIDRTISKIPNSSVAKLGIKLQDIGIHAASYQIDAAAAIINLAASIESRQ